MKSVFATHTMQLIAKFRYIINKLTKIFSSASNKKSKNKPSGLVYV